MLAVTNTVVFIHKISRFGCSFKTRKWKQRGGYTLANWDNIKCPIEKVSWNCQGQVALWALCCQLCTHKEKKIIS